MKFKIKFVNGDKIRTFYDEDFTNFGQYYRFNFIPENEFWIDIASNKKEVPFYIVHLIEEYNLMKQGISYNNAYEIACRKEVQERKNTLIKEENNNKKWLPKIEDQLLLKIDGVCIWLVNGKVIRDMLDVNFVEGGHFLKYSYIPPYNIWIDKDTVKSQEYPFIILHEMKELSFMEEGMPYIKAHIKASMLEWKARWEFRDRFTKMNVKSKIFSGWWKTVHGRGSDLWADFLGNALDKMVLQDIDKRISLAEFCDLLAFITRGYIKAIPANGWENKELKQILFDFSIPTLVNDGQLPFVRNPKLLEKL